MWRHPMILKSKTNVLFPLTSAMGDALPFVCPAGRVGV